MAQKRLIFSPESLVSLLTHYTDGFVPLDTVVMNVEVSQYTTRMIGLLCKSEQWTDASTAKDSPDNLSPLHIRYEGSKTMKWGNRHEEAVWTDSIEAPKRQY